MNIRKGSYTKLRFLIGTLVTITFIVLGIYYFTPISTKEKIAYNKDYIIFQGNKVSVGETFNFSPNDTCVKNTEATLDAIKENSVTFKIKEWDWKKELNTSVEEVTDYVVHDKDCITARPICMDVGYKYCFSLSTIDSIQNITYELESYSTMPKPPAL